MRSRMGWASIFGKDASGAGAAVAAGAAEPVGGAALLPPQAAATVVSTTSPAAVHLDLVMLSCSILLERSC